MMKEPGWKTKTGKTHLNAIDYNKQKTIKQDRDIYEPRPYLILL